MSADPQTMRVMPTHPSQGEWVVINAADFDPALHVDFDEHAAAEPAQIVAPSAAPARRGRPPKHTDLKGA